MLIYFLNEKEGEQRGCLGTEIKRQGAFARNSFLKEGLQTEKVLSVRLTVLLCASKFFREN